MYRRLWGWPLRSPRHLIGTLVVLALLVTAVGIALPMLVGDTGSPPPRRSSAGDSSYRESQPEGSGRPMQTRLTAPLRTPTPAPAAPEALQTAAAFAAAWVNHPPGMSSQQWTAQLAPFTTEEYLPQLATVDPANVPASRVTGPPAAELSYTSSVDARVPTDGPALSITVVQTRQGWRVNQYEQAG